MQRTHHCNELRIEHVGQNVQLTGWVHARRDHGGVIFIDLRDREGLTQIVFNPQAVPHLAEMAHGLRSEYVISVGGRVIERPEGTVNKHLKTGEVEVHAEALEVLNTSQTPPFPMDEETVSEELRLTYRYLDLRRPLMARNLRMRHQTAQTVRAYLNDLKFLEVETPMLFKSTPEGAREFISPSRLNPGKFYALPQSPQQFKQLLMVGGIERYYQIVRCFRDEDLRADRQPEFTQIDIEMSFIGREDIYSLIENLIKKIWKEVLDIQIQIPFERITFQYALDNYGIDKPDRRFEMKLIELSDLFAKSELKVFRTAVEQEGVVKAINAKGLACITAGQLETLTHIAVSNGAKGLAWIKVENGVWDSPIAKFFTEEEKAVLKERLKMEEGDLILFAAGPWLLSCEILGQVRLKCAEFLEKLGKLHRPKDKYDFMWVIDFPLLTWDRESGRYVATHHPFTAPVPEDIPLLDTAPEKVRGQHYDIVLNGTELGGGSIRIHQPPLQHKIFTELLKIPHDIAEKRFGYLIRAFEFGAPPHGGIALGFDRLAAILTGNTSIREVIAFPKNNQGQDLMNESPGEVEPKHLRELRIQSI